MELDIDEPSIEALQALMILAQANFQLGKGKRTYMLLSMLYASDVGVLPVANLVSQPRPSAWPLRLISIANCHLR
jgi:hypothetical protein